MHKSKAGFSLIESLIGSAVLVIFFSAIAVMTYSTVKLVGESQVKVVATNLAQEQLEVVKNMPYTDVGTVEGVPNGLIQTPKVVEIDDFEYTIETQVVFIDDPFDGQAPVDSVPTDYKRMRVSVTWEGVFKSRSPLVMWTDISPKGLETDVGGGAILIQVIDGNGEAVAEADVVIDAPSLSPAVYVETTTDNDGLVEIPGAPACSECYKIAATKTGYTSDRTYGAEEVDNPAKPHLSVIEGDLTQTSFSIDEDSAVTFKAVRSNYTAFQGVQMRVYGSKEIGRTSADEPVYKYDEQVVTGAGGQILVSGMEWDTYTVEIPAGSSVDFAGSWPFSPFSLLPNSSVTFTTVVVAAEDDTLLVRVLDNFQTPISLATIELKNDLESYIATKSTAVLDKPDRAQAFFTGLPDTLTPYTLTASSSGYDDAVTEATVSGGVVEQFLLNPE